jgi:hypothetical protein
MTDLSLGRRTICPAKKKLRLNVHPSGAGPSGGPMLVRNFQYFGAIIGISMRYLYLVESDELFAYAPGRRDFFKSSDDTLWAHESHEWLVAKSGEVLAHRTGEFYYDAVRGERLYHVTTDRIPPREPGTESPASDSARVGRSSRRALNALH